MSVDMLADLMPGRIHPSHLDAREYSLQSSETQAFVGVLEATASRCKEMQISLVQGELEFVSSKCQMNHER